MADNNESLAYPELVDMVYALEFFGLMIVFCLLLCFCHRCCYSDNENDFNSSGSGFRRGRELVFRDTVTAPAVLFSKRMGGSQASNNQVDEESSIF